ncbi:hypothetical protein ACUOBA_35335, partial [Escherichia coli]
IHHWRIAVATFFFQYGWNDFSKLIQFLGMEPLPTFIANDVIKMPDVPRYTEEYRKHLVEIFG